MAKKGQVQLQAEINNDDEWDRLLLKDGLILIDIYSEWCGPCAGMAGNLKKIKLEVGGDLLQLAVANANGITALERFKNKSEPTWMFVVEGKMSNLMFGANSPQLTNLIIHELNKEKSVRSGIGVRHLTEISELSAEERQRAEVLEAKEREVRRKQEARAARELRERRTLECNQILEHNTTVGVIIVFPQSRAKYNEVLRDPLRELELSMGNVEKINIKEEDLEELFFFAETTLPDELLDEIYKKQSIGLIIRHNSEQVPNIDYIISQMVYGTPLQPPGDENCPFQQLLSETKTGEEKIGLWVPPNDLAKAAALKLFFPAISGPYKLPKVDPIPPHLAVAYDAFKYKDVLDLSVKYPGEILKYGFFTRDIPAEAKLIAKTVEKFETKPDPNTYEEKIVVQLAKRNSECFLEFCELGPSYISPDTVQGEEECKIFFPIDYDIPEKTASKKKKRRRKQRQMPVEENEEALSGGEVSDAHVESDSGIMEEEDSEEHEEVEDKATSPLSDGHY